MGREVLPPARRLVRCQGCPEYFPEGPCMCAGSRRTWRGWRPGDRLLVGGQAFTVVDILGQPRGGKRLDLGDGVQLVIQPDIVLYATRTVRPRRAERRSSRDLRH